MRILFAFFAIEVACFLVCYGRLERKCMDGDPNCLDFDYHYEEAAKETVLNNSNSITFNSLAQPKPTKENITHAEENRKFNDWWAEWNDVVPDLFQRKADNDIETLCKASDTENIYSVCQDELSGMIACVGTVNGTVDQCKKLRGTQSAIPICKEAASKRMVTCGPYRMFLCYPLEENKPPITPCHDPFRRICLSQNGSLIKCIEWSYFTNAEINILQSVQHKETSDWWDKWKLLDPEQMKNDTEKEVRLLCLHKNGKGDLSYCNGNKSDTPACLNVTFGEIGECNPFIGKDIGVPICSEVHSNRVITCDKRYKLCFPVGDEEKPINPCQVEDLQICLSDEGKIKKCKHIFYTSYSGQTSEDIEDYYKEWNDWWAEWVSAMPVMEENKEVYLCHSDEGDRMLKTCFEESSEEKLCVSAKYGEIDFCKNFGEAALAFALCIQESSNKLTTCKDYGSAYLCLPSGNESKPIGPCWSESRHICLNDEGFLQKCHNSLPRYNSENKNYTMAYSDIFYYFNQWWYGWFSTKNALEINLPEGVSQRLCYVGSGGIVDCSYDSQKNYVCAGAVTGQIEVCEDMRLNELPVPICREVFTNKVITCGRHTLAFLCFPASKEGFLFQPCGSVERHVCLGHYGKLELCVESASYLSFLDRKMSESQRTMVIWSDWWKEWQNDTSVDEEANITGQPLCKHDSKKLIITCKKAEINKMLCVSARQKKIGLCKSFLATDLAVRICIDNSSKRIMACGYNMSAFLCAPIKGKSSSIHPCRYPTFQICLKSEGVLEHCLEYTGLSTSSKPGLLISVEDIYSRDREISEMKRNQLRYLCKDDDDSRILRCSAYFSYPPACISTRKRKIESCEKIESDSDIGLPVCVDVSTSKLLTCAKFNEENLCFTKKKKTTRLVLCKTKSRNVCITEEGSVTKCSEYFNSSENYIDEDYNSNVLIRIESKKFEYYQKNITFLCMQGRERFKECASDPSTNFACYSSKYGNFHSCEFVMPSDLSIPVCIQGMSKAIVTCGKMNNVNLCSSPGKKRYKFKPCKSEKHFVCLKDESIHECQNNDSIYNKKTKLLIKLEYTNIKNNDYQVSINQTYYKSHKVENKTLKYQPQNCSRLCVLHSFDKKVVKPCEEDPYINFACFGVKKGTVDSCDSLTQTELLTPICVKTTDEVVTYGMFFKAHLCLEKEGYEFYMKTCNIKEKRICLSALGTLEECNKLNAKNRKELESYEKIQDFIEELSDYDSSGESVTISQMNSNIKTAKSKEGKLKSDMESYRRLKMKSDMKLLEKKSGKENKQSKKVADEKYKSAKKDHKSKKSKSIVIFTKANNGFKTIENNNERERIGIDTNLAENKQNLREAMYIDYIDNDMHEVHNIHGNIEKRDAADIEEMPIVRVQDFQKKDLESSTEDHRNAIREKESKLIENIKRFSRHLCKLGTENEKLEHCEKDFSKRFACMRVNDGTLIMCQESSGEEIVLPVCFEEKSKNLVTCDIISNVELCLRKAGNPSTLAECEIYSSHACLVDDVVAECRKHHVRRSSGIPYASSTDEKFYRLYCKNCSIASRFVLRGNIPGYLPELESIELDK